MGSGCAGYSATSGADFRSLRHRKDDFVPGYLQQGSQELVMER